MTKIHFKTIMLASVLFMCIMPLAFAETFYNNQTLGSSGAIAHGFGFSFKTNASGYYYFNATKHASVTATIALMYENNTWIRSTTNLTGNNFQFGAIPIVAGANYSVVVCASGSNYNRQYSATALTPNPFVANNNTIAFNYTADVYALNCDTGLGLTAGANAHNLVSMSLISNSTPPTPPSSNFSITLKDFYTAASLSNFSATISGVTYTTTTGTITTGLYQNNTNLWSINLSSTENGGYFNKTLTNVNISSNLASTLAQSEISFAVFEKITNNTISGANFSTSYLTNTTHYMRAQSYNVTANKSGYFPIINSVSVQAQSVQTTYIYNMSAAYLNFTLKENITGATITTYTAILNNSAYGYSETQSTTNGTLYVPSLAGAWSITINGTNYALTTFNETLVNGTNNLTRYVFTTNSMYFFVYDELTRNLIVNLSINIELIGNYFSYNATTTNGTWYRDLVTPDTYTIRTTAAGYTQRFYYFALVNRSSNIIQLYLLNNSAGTNVTATVVDLARGGQTLEGAYIFVQKYNTLTNTYITREIIRTNFQGQAVFDAQYNAEYYKFIVQYPLGTTLTETTPSYITSTSITIPVSTTASSTSTWQTIYGVSGQVSYNPSTGNFRYTYTDPSLVIDNACLYVYRLRNNFSTSLVNSSCSTAHSATILLNVINLTAGEYYAKGTIELNGEEYVIDTANYSFNNISLWGVLGIFLSAIITMVVQFMFKNPIASLIVMPIPILAFSVIGLTAIPLAMVVGLSIMCWIGAILASRWA